MRWFFRYKLHHIIFWILYFIFWTWFSVHSYGTPVLNAILSTTIYFIGQAGIGYFSIYFLLPRYFFTRQYGLLTLFVLTGTVAGALFIVGGMDLLFPFLSDHFGFSTFFLYSLISVFFSTLLFISIKVIKERVNAQKLNSVLEKEKTEHELKFLKAQTNPHFLFNAINSIYVLIKKDPDLAESTLARFSDMLRYQLYECNLAEVPVDKEMEYLSNYIEMEKIRKGKALVVRYTTELSGNHFMISPLLIIPFVENAFKHVSNFSERENLIDIHLCYQKGIFILTVKNSMDPNRVRHAQDPGGIGQENTKRRLELIYPGRHELSIRQDSETYFASLTILLP